jgi:hypothetical protein
MSGINGWEFSVPFVATSGVSDFKKLLVWQKAHALGLHAHRVAMGIRRSQDLALRGQITRAAMSIPANIVEGQTPGE